MADIFLGKDARQLLNHKRLVFIGDSNMRAAYKDLIQLTKNNVLMSSAALKTKLEKSFNCDKLVFRGKQTNGRDFREEREYNDGQISLYFYFITRCFDEYMESILKNMTNSHPPHVVIMNSCLWDVSRWGPHGVDAYKDNLKKLMQRLQEVLPKECLMIWTTTLPVSQDLKGGFLIPQVRFLRHQLRFEILEANQYAYQVATSYGFDVLDLHYHMHMQIHRRATDGIHWAEKAVRHVTNLLLTHIAVSWNVQLPNRFKSSLLEETKQSPLAKEYHPHLKLLQSSVSKHLKTQPSLTPRKIAKASRRNHLQKKKL